MESPRLRRDRDLAIAGSPGSGFHGAFDTFSDAANKRYMSCRFGGINCQQGDLDVTATDRVGGEQAGPGCSATLTRRQRSSDVPPRATL
jgi:hypothetical protein